MTHHMECMVAAAVDVPLDSRQQWNRLVAELILVVDGLHLLVD